MAATPKNVTALLADWTEGDESARDQLIPLVYDQLRRLARRQLAGERPDHSLQPTALVNEAYLLLAGRRGKRWQNRAHFFALAAQMMRHILVDHARKRRRAKRDGGTRVPLNLAVGGQVARDADLVALDDALRELAAMDSRRSRVVELRYFGGMSVEETAEVLKVSTITVIRDWNVAKAWLYQAVGDGVVDRDNPS